MSTAPVSPLHALHQQAQAEFQPYGDIEIVQTFGEPQAEYAALHKGCGIMNLAQRAVIAVTGRDRLDFLNRFVTNQLIDKQTSLPMAAGCGVYAFVLNNKGRIIADLNILERGERTLVETDARNVPTILAHLQKYIFSESVSFADLTPELAEIALLGPQALGILGRVCGEIGEMPPWASRETKAFGVPLTVWRDDPTGAPGYFILLPREQVAAVWMGLTNLDSPAANDIQQGKRTVRPVGWAAFNTARIEAGRALFGIDFDDSVLPLETPLFSAAVSVTKGCYLGQEIVARMHARQQSARRIVGIRMEEDALPLAGAPVFDPSKAQNQVGAVTSSTISPILSRSAIALAMMRTQFAPPGTRVSVAAEGAMRPAAVVELPFLR